MRIHSLFFAAPLLLNGVSAFAQNPLSVQPAPSAATAPTVVPALVPFSAIAQRGDGAAISGERTVTFQLFRDETGGEPLWTESQTVDLDETGHYKVQLGASSPQGLPMTLFASGEGRWLEVQIAGEKQQPRALLTSVPYALKAADAATLGGLPASAFMLAHPNNTQQTGASGNVASSGPAPGVIVPDASTVTTTGGTNHYVPVFTGSTTIAKSEIYDSGTSVGIGDVPNASSKLDINGAMIVRGNTIVSRTGNATTSKGFPSYQFSFYSNAYNSSKGSTDNPNYSLQSEPVGNNSSETGATFNLLYANGNGSKETGLVVNSGGQLLVGGGARRWGTGDGQLVVNSLTGQTSLVAKWANSEQ